MKSLTVAQLNELGIYNPWEFCYESVYLSFVAHSRETMGSFGWHVTLPISGRKATLQNANGRTKPCQHEDLPLVLAGFGMKCDGCWVRFMGAWMPLDFYGKRMAGLVEEYRALKKGKSDASD